MSANSARCKWCVTYIEGAELPDLGIWWVDSVGELVDFSTGWTFTVEVGRKWQPAVLTKTTGITGAVGSGEPDDPDGVPNLAIMWATGELDTLAPGNWTLEVTAVAVDGRDRKTQGKLTITPQVLAEVP